GLDVVRCGVVVEKFTHFSGREVQPEWFHPLRLHQQTTIVGVVDLVIASRVSNERRLIGIVLVEGERWRSAIESQVSVKTGGELDDVGVGVLIELAGQQVVGDEAESDEEGGKRRGAPEHEPRLEAQRHGGAAVSM